MNGANGLEITMVELYPVKNPQGKLRAFVRIQINKALQLTTMRVYEGCKGLFVSYPNDASYKGDDYRQVFYPLSREFREYAEKTILEAYAKQMEGEA